MSDPLSAAAVAVMLATGAQVTDPLVLEAMAESRVICAESGGTRLVFDEAGLITEVDLTGDGQPDRIVHEATALCEPGGGYLHTGSGGAPIHVIIGQTVQRLANGVWTVTDISLDFGQPQPHRARVLLQAVHGSACGGAGLTLCLVAHVWDGQRMVSILDGMDDLTAD